MKGVPRKIGVMVNDINSDYVGEILDGIYSYCDEEGASLFIFGVGELDYSYRPFGYQQMSLSKFCRKNNIDGLIVCSSVLGNHVEGARLDQFIKGFMDIPLVSVGKKIPGAPSVLCDVRVGIEEVLDDFICNHARKKFCVLGNIPDSVDAKERTDIIASYLRNHGRRFDERCILPGNFTYENASRLLEEYWEQKGSFEFDAIMALNDDMAFAALDFCAKHNIQVPSKVSVAGFDDVPRAEFSRPSLTTVNQRLPEQGSRAAEALFSLMDKKRVSDEILVSSSARFRKSCACVPEEETGLASWIRDEKTGALRKSESKTIGSEWLEKKNQLHIMNDFLASWQARLNLARFRKMFKDFAGRFAISAAAVCVYDAPVCISEKQPVPELPDSARLLASFDNKNNYVQNINEEPIPFNPRELIVPKGAIDTSRGQYMLWILSDCEKQYGYLIFRKGGFESLFYSLMCTAFSKILSEAWETSHPEN